MRFTYLWPWWAVALGFIGIAAASLYTYLRLRRPLQPPLRFLLMALRISAALVLLICLLEPVWIERKDITPQANLLVLADTSLSMQIDDVELAGEKLPRQAFVNRLLLPDSPFLSEMAERFDLHLYRFDEHLHQISQAEGELESTGRLTNLLAAVQNATAEWRGQPLAGVVLLTDGAHNVSVPAFEEIASAKTPIYAVGIGNPNAPKDLRIASVDVSPVVYTEHEVPVRVTVQHTGYAGSKLRLSLSQDGKVVTAVPISLTDAPVQTIEFSLTPQTEGIFQYTVSLPVLEDELTGENNERIFPLKVVKTKLRVLYVDGRPRWEYAFLKRTLERDPNVEPVCLIISGRPSAQLRDTALARSGGYYPQATDLSAVPKFPETLQQLLAYDVLIIGDLEPRVLSQTQQQAVVDFVEKHGKAVVFLGGKNSLGPEGFKTTPLANLLPVVLPPAGSLAYDMDVSPQPTQQGLYHPITRLGDSDAMVEAVWRDLPALPRWIGGFRLKSGATVLAEHSQQRRGVANPLIVFQRSGLGKSLLLAGEGFWHWGFGVWSFKDSDDSYARFWGQTIRWMATRTDAKQITVTTNQTSYAVGDEVQITVYAYDASYQPMEDASLTVDVTPPNGRPFQMQPRQDTQTVGVYRTQFRASQKGTYHIRTTGAGTDRPLSPLRREAADAHQSAWGSEGGSLGEDATQISVQAPLAEFENPQLNVALLKTLSEKTGGYYVAGAEATTLPGKIEDVRERVYAVQERPLWNTPIVLILVVVLLGTEWFLRKRSGLV